MRSYLLGPLSIVAFGLSLLPGCGSGSGQTATAGRDDQSTTARITPNARDAPSRSPLGDGSKVRDCDIVFAGPGPADWRGDAYSVGPFGISRRSFLQDAYEADGPLYRIKTPTILEGHRPVRISIPPEQRFRVGILVVDPDEAYGSVTYVPCDDRPRTAFPAGFLLRDRKPITLRVQVGKGPVRALHIRG
ncbi:MAG: hypothetical protein R2725_15885 [Solirubrobacterales bacterium]